MVGILSGADQHPRWAPRSRPMPTPRDSATPPWRHATPAYPLGVGHSMIFIRPAREFEKEDRSTGGAGQGAEIRRESVWSSHQPMLDGRTVEYMRDLIKTDPRIRHADGEIDEADADTPSTPDHLPPPRMSNVVALCTAELTDEDWGNNTQRRVDLAAHPDHQIVDQRARNSRTCLRTKYGIKSPASTAPGGPDQTAGRRSGDGRRPREVRDTGGRCWATAQEAQPAHLVTIFVGIALGVLQNDPSDERSAARETGSGGRSADGGGRDPFPSGDLHHHESNLMQARSASRCSSPPWESAPERRIHRCHRRGRIPLDRLRRHHHSRPR